MRARVSDLERFESDRFISRLLGMGDIKGLIDLAPEDLDEQEAMRLTQRLMSGRFTLNDMYQQMEMMSKIGTLDRILSLARRNVWDGINVFKPKEGDAGEPERYRIMMDSMTQEEKDDPKLLKSERIRRIARGSGSSEKDVKALLAQWNKSRKMMRGMKGNRQFRRQMQSMMDVEDLDLV